jgi:hypothetical protein
MEYEFMPFFLCCRCPKCSARIVLDQMPGLEPVSLGVATKNRSGREACSYCRAIFVPENYHIVESDEDLKLG